MTDTTELTPAYIRAMLITENTAQAERIAALELELETYKSLSEKRPCGHEYRFGPLRLVDGQLVGCALCDIAALEAENAQMKSWVADLQSGMYVNCVYCGHRYGPNETTPVSMADALKAHVENCPKHPMSKLKAENAALRPVWEAVKAWVKKRRVPYGGEPVYEEIALELAVDAARVAMGE